MRLILLGPPGAGKGTQAQVLSQNFSLPHISTGDLLRNAIKQDSPIGLKAKAYMEKGELVPDNLVIEIVTKRMEEADAEKGFILDGFPRNQAQAKQLDKALNNLAINIDLVINLDASEKTVIARLAGRRVCKNCGFNYHIKNIPPKIEGVCDKCGGALYQRTDDKEDTIKNRLKVYRDQTEELITYYKNKNLLTTVSGDLSAQELFLVLKKVFAGHGLI